MTRRACLVVTLAGVTMGVIACSARREGELPRTATVTSVAYRVHHMPEMLAFYREAFGIEFREVDTGGLRSQFGAVGGVTLKFVPIRDAADFESFPVHQLGFEVHNVDAVVAAARKHGGRLQDQPVERDGRLHAAVRDPDGNTLELYGRH